MSVRSAIRVASSSDAAACQPDRRVEFEYLDAVPCEAIDQSQQWGIDGVTSARQQWNDRQLARYRRAYENACAVGITQLVCLDIGFYTELYQLHPSMHALELLIKFQKPSDAGNRATVWCDNINLCIDYDKTS